MATKKKAELILLLMTLIWGSTFVVMKIGFDYTSAFLFVGLRFTFGAIVFGAIFFRNLKKIKINAIKKGAFLGLLLGVGLLLQTFGLQFTTASKSAFVTGTMVIFTPIVQLLIEKRMPKIGNIIGVALVTLGLYLLTMPTGDGMNYGDMITLVSALLFGIYIVYVDIYTKEEDFLQLGFVQIVVTALLSWALLPFEIPKFIFSWNLLWIFIFMSVLATVLTTYANSKYQRFTTPTRAAILFTFEPVVSAILAYVVLHEMMGTVPVIGGAIIVAGILVSELSDIFLKKYSWKLKIPEEE